MCVGGGGGGGGGVNTIERERKIILQWTQMDFASSTTSRVAEKGPE